ncbi:proline racemase family protein, partial [Rhodoferax sp.]|uniref:proline racemase family protein n=1 Tax=Rhodoferax sp. TaxID=50421 RepID=UPI00274BC286|nr:proline racemase family protein [Rhodoferax sp.]
MEKIQCVDSHTGGEPTRLVVCGFPDLAGLPLPEAVSVLRSRHDHYRKATVCEPRGNDVLVGALLLPPVKPGSLASVVFFNNVGYLGMCGHGSIGLMATLEYLGRITPGPYAIDTPVGTVKARLHGKGRVSVDNVASYRHLAGIALEVKGYGRVVGDVAWGGNWFFLLDARHLPLTLAGVDALTRFAQAVRQALRGQGITGRNGAEIDHIELTGVAHEASHDARNFVLCPGGAYDRSPCGTGTSAKLACLAADGQLAEGEVWHQESVIGSVFEGKYRREGELVYPTITGQAHLSGELT